MCGAALGTGSPRRTGPGASRARTGRCASGRTCHPAGEALTTQPTVETVRSRAACHAVPARTSGHPLAARRPQDTAGAAGHLAPGTSCHALRARTSSHTLTRSGSTGATGRLPTCRADPGRTRATSRGRLRRTRTRVLLGLPGRFAWRTAVAALVRVLCLARIPLRCPLVVARHDRPSLHSSAGVLGQPRTRAPAGSAERHGRCPAESTWHAPA